MVFINLKNKHRSKNSKKANNKIPKGLIWQILDKKSVPRSYIEIIKTCIREQGAIMSTRTTCGKMGLF